MIHQALLLAAFAVASGPKPADILFAFAQEDSVASFREDPDGRPYWVMADQFDGDTLLAIRALKDGLYASRVLAWNVINALPETGRAKVAAWCLRSGNPALADAGGMIRDELFRCPHCRGSRECPARANFEFCEPCSRLPWPGDVEDIDHPCRRCGATGRGNNRP